MPSTNDWGDVAVADPGTNEWGDQAVAAPAPKPAVPPGPKWNGQVAKRPFAGRVADVVAGAIGEPSGLGLAGWTGAIAHPIDTLSRPVIPESVTKPLKYALTSSAGDVVASLPGATPGFRKAVEGEVGGLAKVAESIATPLTAVAGPLLGEGGAAAQAVKGAFAAQMATQAPESFKQVQHALKYGKESDIAEATTGLAAAVGLPVAMVHAELARAKPAPIVPPDQGPPAPGSMIRMPEGARPTPEVPLREVPPPAPIPPKTPPVAAIAPPRAVPGPVEVKPENVTTSDAPVTPSKPVEAAPAPAAKPPASVPPASAEPRNSLGQTREEEEQLLLERKAKHDRDQSGWTQEEIDKRNALTKEKLKYQQGWLSGDKAAGQEFERLSREIYVLENRHGGTQPPAKSPAAAPAASPESTGPFHKVGFAPLAPVDALHATNLEVSNPLRLRVAAKTPGGTIISGKAGEIHANLEKVPIGSDWGFVDESGKYYTRDEAGKATYTAQSKAALPPSLRDPAAAPAPEAKLAEAPPAVKAGTGKEERPSIGTTGKEIYQNWKSQSSGTAVMPRENVVGVVPGEGVFSWRGDKIVREFSQRAGKNKGYVSTYREATPAEIDTIHDAIDKGTFQVESRIVKGALGLSTHIDAGKTMKVLHQATGKPLPEFLESDAGKEWLKRQEAYRKRHPFPTTEPAPTHESLKEPQPGLAPGSTMSAGEPGIISMGGLAPGDPGEPVGKGGLSLAEAPARTTGTNVRSLEQRKESGLIKMPEPGAVHTPEEWSRMGKTLDRQPGYSERILTELAGTDRPPSAAEFAALSAHSDKLEKAEYDAAAKHGVVSPEFEAAFDANTAWADRLKVQSTKWGELGRAQQGQRDIDTGDFIALQVAFRKQTGRDFTPSQTKTAHEIADKNKAAAEAVAETAPKVGPAIDKLPGAAPDGSDLAAARKQFGDYKPGTPLSPQQVKTLWNYAKRQYLDKFETDFGQIRQGLADDFGLSKNDVARGLAQPKAIRAITDDLAVALSERRRLASQARNWLKDQQYPGWLRWLKKVNPALFNLAIFGHGTTWIGTHTPTQVFNPRAWSTLFPAWFNSLKTMGLFLKDILKDNKKAVAFHEGAMQDLRADPLYSKARRAGLVNDPHKFTDEYQNRQMETLFKKFGLAGNMAWDWMKVFRQANFNKQWKALPPHLQTSAYAEILAKAINHASGASTSSFGKYEDLMGSTFFAPHLEASRWAWLLKDPAVAAKTFAGWKNASVEQRHAAIAELKQKAAIAGLYYGLLQMNQGLLNAAGSKDKINFTDPRRLDFLAFKVAGHAVGIGTPMLGIVRLFANLAQAGFGQPKGIGQKLSSRTERVGEVLGHYARNKLSPAAQLGADAMTQEDVLGNTMPWSKDKLPAYKLREGKHQLTPLEFAGETFTPIPISEAVREVFTAQGLSRYEADTYLKALLAGAAAGGAGVRITETPPERK